MAFQLLAGYVQIINVFICQKAINCDRTALFVGSHWCIHPGRLSLLPSVGSKLSTSQKAVMLCGCGIKAGMVLFAGKIV